MHSCPITNDRLRNDFSMSKLPPSDHSSLDQKVLEQFYAVISESKQAMYERIAQDRTTHLTVVLENIFQEHNASAVLRSCDCFGIQDLHVIEKDNQYQVQRDIALGAGRWVDLYNYKEEPSPSMACIADLRKKGYKIVATTPHTDTTIDELSLDQPLALVFGTEKEGISDDIWEMADEFVKIPMYGFTESFNISVSVAITLHALRERLEKSKLNWKLDEKEQTLLKINWCKKILRSGEEMEKEFRKRIL
jgi:tRNA (guanosine-2'-O-)-methyltransferase